MARAMGVITTVGFTAFTRICARADRRSARRARRPGHEAWVMGGLPAGLTLCGPSSRAITLVSMSRPPLVEPARSRVPGA